MLKSSSRERPSILQMASLTRSRRPFRRPPQCRPWRLRTLPPAVLRSRGGRARLHADSHVQGEAARVDKSPIVEAAVRSDKDVLDRAVFRAQTRRVAIKLFATRQLLKDLADDRRVDVKLCDVATGVFVGPYPRRSSSAWFARKMMPSLLTMWRPTALFSKKSSSSCFFGGPPLRSPCARRCPESS